MATWKEAIKIGEVIDHHPSGSYILTRRLGVPPYDTCIVRSAGDIIDDDCVDEAIVDEHLTEAGINDDQWVIDPNFPHKGQ
jgi:hypothetical protein